MGSWSDSVTLTKVTFGLIRKDPALLGLALLGGLSLIGLIALVAGPFAFTYLVAPTALYAAWSSPSTQILFILIWVGLYVGLAFVGMFFSAALLGAAMDGLNGGQPTVRSGLAFARARAWRIFVWAVFSATVGALIQAIAARFQGIVGAIISIGAGITWSVVTYFMLPVVLFESGEMWPSLKRSAHLFSETFGRTLFSNLLVGLIVGLVAIGSVVLLGVGVFLLLNGLFGLGLLLLASALSIIVVAAIVGAAAEAVLKAALYRYATTGQLNPSFPLPSRFVRWGSPEPPTLPRGSYLP